MFEEQQVLERCLFRIIVRGRPHAVLEGGTEGGTELAVALLEPRWCSVPVPLW
jgi:hypothetical protein